MLFSIFLDAMGKWMQILKIRVVGFAIGLK